MPNSKSIAETVSESFDLIAKRVDEMLAVKPKTTSDAIIQDHKALRNFLDVLKDSSRTMTERKKAYKYFSALLKSHSLAEEKALYDSVEKLTEKDLKIEVAEGFVEHDVTNDLMARIESLSDNLQWGAHANVLAELVEHHLDEEEEELLPLVREYASRELDEAMLMQYLDLRKMTQKTVNEENAGVLKSIH